MATAQPDKAFLYHASSAAVTGDALMPGRNTTLAGIEGEYVFAGDDEAMAYAYALKQHGTVTDIPRMRACLAIRRTPCAFLEFRHLLPLLPPGRIYKVPPENFEAVTWPDGTPSGEYVSPLPVPLARCIITDGITPDDVMRKGVQIFFLEDDALLDGKFGGALQALRREASNEKMQDDAILKYVRELLAAQRISHLNALRGIQPHSAFANL